MSPIHIVSMAAAVLVLCDSLTSMAASPESKKWLDQLISGEYHEKAIASSRLAEFGKPVVRDLLRLLDHPNNDVREYAVRTLRALGTDAAIATDRLIVALSDKSMDVRIRVIQALSVVGKDDSAVADALLPLLEDSDAEVRLASIAAIARLGIRELHIVEALLKAAKKGVPETKSVYYALAELGPISSPAIPLLVRDASHPQEFIRSASAAALGAIGDPQVLSTLIRMTEDDAVGPRWLALRSIGMLRSKPDVCVPLLLKMLKDTEPQVRGTAVRALAQFGPLARIAIPVLSECVRNDDWALAAGEALASIGPESQAAVPSLIEMYETAGDYRIRVMIVDMLKRIGGPVARKRLKRIANEAGIELRRAAWEALQTLPP